MRHRTVLWAPLALLLLAALSDAMGMRGLMKARRREDPMRGVDPFGFTGAIGKYGPCQGLVDKMCKPCPPFTLNSLDPEPDFCKTAKDECAKIFCLPLCRRITWKCDVEFGELEEAKSRSFKEALCGQFKAQGCVKTLGCCAEDELLYQFIDEYTFQDQYPDPLLPSPSCVQGPSEELCAKCNANVKVKLTPGECPFSSAVHDIIKKESEQGSGPGGEGEGDGEGEGGEGGEGDAFIQIHALGRKRPASDVARDLQASITNTPRGFNYLSRISPTKRRRRFRKTPPPALNAFSSSELAMWSARDNSMMKKWALHFTEVYGKEKPSVGQCQKGPDGEHGDWPLCPDHKNMQERCEVAVETFSGALGGMEAEFQEAACKCMGCCEGQCFYPVTVSV